MQVRNLIVVVVCQLIPTTGSIVMVTLGSTIREHGNGVSTATWTGEKPADWIGQGVRRSRRQWSEA